MGERATEWISFRCTEGEERALRAAAEDRGMRTAAYVAWCFAKPAGLREAVDWDVVRDAAVTYAARGDELNELAHALNTLAVLARNDDFGVGAALRAADKAASAAFEVASLDRRMHLAFDALSRACDVGGVFPRAVGPVRRMRHMTIRVPEEPCRMARAWASDNCMTVTEAVLAQCVYRDSLPARVERDVVEGLRGEAARQLNNAEQVERALREVGECAREYMRHDPLNGSCRSLAHSAAESTRELARAVEAAVTPVMSAGRLARCL